VEWIIKKAAFKGFRKNTSPYQFLVGASLLPIFCTQVHYFISGKKNK